MDANLQNILLGVAGNVLTSFLAVTYRGIRDYLAPNQKAGFDLQNSLESTTEKLSEIMNWGGPGRVEEVCLFLTSAETASIMRQLFSAHLVEPPTGTKIQIKEEFISSLARFIDEKKEDIEIYAGALFEQVASACDANINEAISQGVLIAHELKSSIRHSLLLDEFATIKKNLAFLEKMAFSVKAVLNFESKYRDLVRQRHAEIIPPNFDTARRIPIGKLYVPPNLATIPKEKGEEAQSLKIEMLTYLVKRGVVLGNPGGGKSTLAQRLVHDLATKSELGTFTPVLVVLRDYGAAKKEKHCSLLQFIELCAAATYQIPPPSGAFEYLFLSGRTFVIFDGLDELLETSHRQDIAKDIELFSSYFPSTHVLVTSRQVGYEQAPLDPQRFDSFILEPFTDEQVREYVNNWFKIDNDLTIAQQSSSANSFYLESRIVADLCTNPLMLALMCNIYRGENYIPTNRPDVYEKCAIMLFERWDKGRGIRVPLPIDAHIRPAMMFLAHWIYADEALQSGVTEAKLVGKTTEYLCPRRFEDEDEARKAAEEFISFCRGRAWVFTDTGTTKDGERLYQFTHRTFLEYFTAAQLVRTHPTPERLLPLLLPRISRKEWDVVAQLAFQIQNKNVEGASDDLLSKLQEIVASNLSRPWSYLSFASRCLEFMVPSPKITRQLSVYCMERAIKGPIATDGPNRRPDIESCREAIAALMTAAAENSKIIEETVQNYLHEVIKGPSFMDAAKAAELGFNMDLPLRTATRRSASKTHKSSCNRIAAFIEANCKEHLILLAEKELRIAIVCMDKGWISMSKVLDHHGSSALFKNVPYKVFPGIVSSSLAGRILGRIHQPINDRREGDAMLIDVANWLIKAEKPFIKTAQVDFYNIRTVGHEALPIRGREAFAIFGLLAVAVESGGKATEEELLQRIRKTEGFNLFASMIRMRQEPLLSSALDELISQLDFNEAEAQFAKQWVASTLSLTSKGAKAGIVGERSASSFT